MAGPSVEGSADSVIDTLKLAAMDSVQATKGNLWGWSDFAYAGFGGSKQGSRDFTIGGQPLSGGLDGIKGQAYLARIESGSCPTISSSAPAGAT